MWAQCGHILLYLQYKLNPHFYGNIILPTL